MTSLMCMRVSMHNTCSGSRKSYGINTKHDLFTITMTFAAASSTISAVVILYITRSSLFTKSVVVNELSSHVLVW